MRNVAAAAVLALLASWAGVARADVSRIPADAHEVDVLRKMSPHALVLLEKGEALAASGQLEAARELFVEGEGEAGASYLIRRRECEVLTAMGRRQQAVNVCVRALEDGHFEINKRALVRALLGGPTGPSPNTLFQALMIVSGERHGSTGAPGPSFMMCDIAESLGDINMLQRCTDEVERIAPNDPDTKRAEALLASHCPPVRFWLGWLAIAAAVIATARDALRRVRVGSKRKWVAVAAGVVVLGSVPLPAFAADDQGARPVAGWLTKWPINDEHPEGSVPTEEQKNGDPLQFGYWLQDVALKAEQASKSGRHEAAARFYLALARAVPDGAVSYRKMCDEYEAAGKRDSAVDACGDALVRDGVQVGDYTHFVHLILTKQGSLTDKEVTAVANVLKHMKDDPNGAATADALQCELAMRTSDTALLRQCTTALAAREPQAPATITYEWALAIRESRFADADKLIAQAQSIGLPVDRMKQETLTDAKRHRSFQLVVVGLLATLIAGSIVLASRFMRRRTEVAPA
jgi:tetratricopeptide (TPR) repeat protein